jgi:hypothetical protein
MTTKEIINQLKSTSPQSKQVLVGFDGFVDNIMHVVDKRKNAYEFNRIEYITDYAKRIEKASGLSTNIEWVINQQKIGGNGPIMTNALLKHQVQLTYVGGLGYPNAHPVFQPIIDQATVVSISDPGFSDAVEFYDGKIIMGRMSFQDMTYDRIIEAMTETKWLETLNQIDLFAAVNWSMLPTMTQLWKDILNHSLPKLEVKLSKPIFFVDIADPEKREASDILEALQLLQLFKSHFTVILGFNKKEAYDVSVALELFTKENVVLKSLEEVSKALYQFLKVDQLVVHPVDRAAVVFEGNYYEVKGPYVEKPKLTTGAGDNFNAGYCLGQLTGLTPEASLLTGVCTSGYYVRQAESPTYLKLIEFIEEFTK